MTKKLYLFALERKYTLGWDRITCQDKDYSPDEESASKYCWNFILTWSNVFAFLLFSRPFSFTILYSSWVAVFITALASDLISFATSCRTFTPFFPFGPSWYIGTLVSESTGKQKTNALFDHFLLKINFLKWQQAMVQAAF